MTSLAELSRRLNSACRRRVRGKRPPPLILLTDAVRLPDPLAAAARLPAGAAVILRHYDDPERAALGLALARLCRAKRLTLLVAEDFALARRLGAGLHLPERRLARPGPAVRLWARSGKGLLSAACHSRQALCRAEQAGAGVALLSPVFATASHPGLEGLGPLAFRRLVKGCRLPVYALGGVSARSILALRGGNAAGAAGIGGFP